MGFVNEFASNDDIEKFNLVGLLDKYRPTSKGRQFELSPPAFTIDRKRNIFFIPYDQGREEVGNRIYALLWIDGQPNAVEIDLVKGSSGNIKDVPFKLVWKLVGLYVQKNVSESRETIIEILKEALRAYGYRGVYMQVPNTIVEFKF